ncbi:hypothetical protein EXW56_23715 [Bacillus mycoides]|nr:hypothetical protein EXW56_23715 [Bacillus mycoides]
MIVNEIISAIFQIYRPQLELYRRFFNYIDRNSNYISDFSIISTVTRIISAIFQLYRLTNN